jgi:hypothetical protein
MHSKILRAGYRSCAERQAAISNGAESIRVEFVHHPPTQIAIRQKSPIDGSIFNENQKVNIQPTALVESPRNDWTPSPTLPSIWTHYLISNLEIESSVLKNAKSIRRLQ